MKVGVKANFGWLAAVFLMHADISSKILHIETSFAVAENNRVVKLNC